MAVLTLLTFVGANLQAVLWQSSSWLVSTVLPAVVVDLTNEERADLAAAPLKRNATLDAAARLKAEHMAENEYFAHYAPDGTSPWYWFDEAGYTYAHAGENLAIHFSDSSEVIEAWMKSPKHRDNIVNNQYTEIGVGTAKGSFEGYETVYVVQLFGTPAEKPLSSPTPARAPVRVTAPVPTPAPQPLTLTTTEEIPARPAAATTSTVLDTSVSEPAATVIAPAEEVSLPIPAEQQLAAILEEPLTLRTSENVEFVETSLMATSSGLAVASIVEANDGRHAGATIASIATKPNTLLQLTYTFIGIVVFILLMTSVVAEARRRQFVQVAYGSFLLVGMAGLWYVHALLTMGAVIA